MEKGEIKDKDDLQEKMSKFREMRMNTGRKLYQMVKSEKSENDQKCKQEPEDEIKMKMETRSKSSNKQNESELVLNNLKAETVTMKKN